MCRSTAKVATSSASDAPVWLTPSWAAAATPSNFWCVAHCFSRLTTGPWYMELLSGEGFSGDSSSYFLIRSDSSHTTQTQVFSNLLLLRREKSHDHGVRRVVFWDLDWWNRKLFGSFFVPGVFLHKCQSVVLVATTSALLLVLADVGLFPVTGYQACPI